MGRILFGILGGTLLILTTFISISIAKSKNFGELFIYCVLIGAGILLKDIIKKMFVGENDENF